MAFGHLSERELVELWPRGAAHPHVAACEACRAEYDALGLVLDAARRAAAEADAHFPPERLAAQQAHILRRLENAERPARILSFPVSSRPFPSVRPVARRWIAGAAAAGLLTGIVAGRALDLRGPWHSDRLRPEATIARDRAPARTPAGASATQGTRDANDETLLIELEAALLEPRVDELRAIDAFTPRVREVSLTR